MQLLISHFILYAFEYISKLERISTFSSTLFRSLFNFKFREKMFECSINIINSYKKIHTST